MAGFADSIDEFRLDFIGGSERAVRGTTIKLWSAIIKSSPVDTGRFRANWFATGAEPSVKVTPKTDKSGSNTINNATQKVLSIKDWSVMTLTNNMPYGQKIEFGGYGEGPLTVGGFSKQAPQGVIRVNIRRFNKLLEEESNKELPR